MFSITSNQVTINNPSIVTFFNKYQTNSIFLSHFEHIIGSLCTTIDTFGIPNSSSTPNFTVLDNNSTLEHLVNNSVSNVAETILSKLSKSKNSFSKDRLELSKSLHNTKMKENYPKQDNVL
jgi:hypothetical protein